MSIVQNGLNAAARSIQRFDCKKICTQTGQGLHIIWRIFNEKSVLAHASICGYSTILSLVPIIAITFAMLSAFSTAELSDPDSSVFSEQSYSNKVFDFFFEYFVPGVAKGAQTELLEARQDFLTFIQKTNQLRYAILVVLVIASISLFNSIEHAFNEIWSVKFRRTLFTRFIAFWLLLTLMPILLGLSYYYTSQLLNSALIIRLQKEQAWFTWILPYTISYTFTCTAFFFANRYLPNLNVRVIPALVGSAICAVLWESAKVAFDIYITYATTRGEGFYSVFGTYSVILIFIVWLYYNYLCFLLSPVIATTIQNFDVHRTRWLRTQTVTSPRPIHAFQIFLIVCKSVQEQNQGAHFVDVAQQTGWPSATIQRCLRHLELAHLVHQDKRERRFYPSVSPDLLSVKQATERLFGIVPVHEPMPERENRIETLMRNALFDSEMTVKALMEKYGDLALEPR